MRKGVVSSADIKKYLAENDTEEAIIRLARDAQVSKTIVKDRVLIFKRLNGLVEDEIVDEIVDE